MEILKSESVFVGYEQLRTNSTVLAIIKNGELVNEAASGDEVQFILDVTPFYAESGGQIADRGTLEAEGVTVTVKDVQKAPNGQNLHKALVVSGTLKTNQKVTATINEENRGKIIKNHTATHLLQRALKDVLGEHVNQAGSLVEPDRSKI